MRDPREPIFRKVGKRYVVCGTVDSPYLKDKSGNWESIRSDGLWLHTSAPDGGWRAMTKLATLDELPCTAAFLGSLAVHEEALAKHILFEIMQKPRSAAETAKSIIHFLSTLNPINK